MLDRSISKKKLVQLCRIYSAKVAELADALDLGSSEATRRGSSPLFRTRLLIYATGDKKCR